MKRFIFIISAAACVLASCIKEAPVGTNGTKVTATVESELTKTVLGEKDGASWPVLWQAGDRIDINGNESAPLAEGGDITAEFSFEAQLTAPFNAIYPASAATGIGTGEIPATHDYTADSFDPDAGVLLGTGDAEGVSFKHAMAYIAFVPQGDGATITSLELTAVGGEKLSGAFTTDYSTLTMSGEASSKVTVNCSTPVALGNEIIAAIPAQTYTQGFKVKFTDSEGGSMEKTAAGSFTAAAGHIYTTTLPYVAESEPDYPETLYMSGGFNDWAAVQLEKIAEGRFQIENYAFNFFNSDEDPKGHGIKFFENIEDWSNQWGPKENWENTEYRGWELAPYADAPQFYPQLAGFESGNYTVLVDFTTMEVTLTAVEEDFDPAKCLYIMGGPFGWAFTESNALLPVADNIYEGHNFHLTPGTEFKFTTYEWGTEYVKDYSAGDDWTMTVRTSETGDMYFVLGADAQGGKYTIRLDLNTMKVSLTLTEASEYPLSLYILGPAAVDAGWNLGNFIPMTMVSPGIFQAENVNISVGAAVDGDNKGNGFKFGISNTSWSTEYGAKEAFDDQDGTTGYRGWELAQNSNQFYPLLMGLTDGYYTITADFNTMKVSMTKE